MPSRCWVRVGPRAAGGWAARGRVPLPRSWDTWKAARWGDGSRRSVGGSSAVRTEIPLVPVPGDEELERGDGNTKVVSGQLCSFGDSSAHAEA